MLTPETTSVETQAAASKQVETVSAAPVAPDAAAQEALKKTEAGQGALVELAEELAPKPKVEAASPAAPAAGSEALTAPTLPATQAEAKESEFLDSVLKYYDAAVARGKGPVGATFDAILFALTSGGAKLWEWVSGFFSGKKKEEGTVAPATAPTTPAASARPEIPQVEKDDPETKKLLGTAKTQLDSALEENPTWLLLSQEASKKFDIPVSTLFSIARFESRFDATATLGEVTGLGQFWGPTWEAFMTENPEFKGASRSDPRASFYAIAWYARKNATECKIDASAPNAAQLLYQAHHNGAGGYLALKAWNEGRRTSAQTVPGTYAGQSFPRYGVTKVNTYEDYAKLVTAMSTEVQTVADFYKTKLPDTASQTLNS